MQDFTRSYVRSIPVRPVSDVDISIVTPMGAGRTEAALAEILATKLSRYYDKATGTVVDGVPDPAGGRPDLFKIAVRAIKARRFGWVAEGSRSIKITSPQRFGSLDVLPPLGANDADVVNDVPPVPPSQLRNAPSTILPSQVPPPEAPDGAAVERRQLRQERDLERRARILLRRMSRVRVRRTRTATVPASDDVDHSTESHRSRAPGWKTWSLPVFRALAAA